MFLCLTLNSTYIKVRFYSHHQEMKSSSDTVPQIRSVLRYHFHRCCCLHYCCVGKLCSRIYAAWRSALGGAERLRLSQSASLRLLPQHPVQNSSSCGNDMCQMCQVSVSGGPSAPLVLRTVWQAEGWIIQVGACRFNTVMLGLMSALDVSVRLQLYLQWSFIILSLHFFLFYSKLCI